MVDWIVIAILYGLMLVLFRIVGGVTSAGDAVRRWGSHTSTRGVRASSSS